MRTRPLSVRGADKSRYAGKGFNGGGRSSAGRVLDCDSSRRGFESHRPPQIITKQIKGLEIKL
jgi:hypothetical protein